MSSSAVMVGGFVSGVPWEGAVPFVCAAWGGWSIMFVALGGYVMSGSSSSS